MSEIGYSLGNFLDDTESNFRSFGVVPNPYYAYIEDRLRSIPGGVSIVGDLQARLKTLWSQTGAGDIVNHIMSSPGDGTRNYGTDENPMRVGLGLPIDYDVWYLFYAGNILLNSKPDEHENDEWITKCIDERMEDYIKEIDSSKTLKPLKQPHKDEAEANVFMLSGGGSASVNGFAGLSPMDAIDNSVTGGWRYTIKEARFETLVKPSGGGVFTAVAQPNPFKINDEPYWKPKEGIYNSTSNPPSPPYGPKEPDSGNYCGYIAFPVGQMGVMWRMSLATESALNDGNAGVYPADYEATVIQGNELLPPFNLNQTKVAGEELFKKGYLVTDHSKVELTAEKFRNIDNPPLHSWMRYWIRTDNTTIVPGELVVLLCRPYPLHCWWFQESAPLMYAGNWIETEFYTSGVVKCVLEKWTDPDSDAPSIGKTDTSGYYDAEEWDFDSGANLYVVWVKNEEIIVSSSDFKEYEVDTRVGLLKCVRDGNAETHTSAVGSVDAISGTGDKFDWESLKWFRNEKKNSRDKDMFTMEWVAVPVDFFGTAGNTLGGA